MKFSKGWLDKFLKRHQFGFRMHRESCSIDETTIEQALPRLQEAISSCDRNDVCNMDKTVLFYHLAPDHTITRQQFEGYKKNEQRITRTQLKLDRENIQTAATCHRTRRDTTMFLWQVWPAATIQHKDEKRWSLHPTLTMRTHATVRVDKIVLIYQLM